MGIPVLAGMGPRSCSGWPCCTATNGMRTIIDDYTRTGRDAASGSRALLYVAATVVIALGTLVIFTFDPTL